MQLTGTLVKRWGRELVGALAAAVLTLTLAVPGAHAGSLTPPAGPDDATSAMFTLEDLYNRLNAGTAGAKRTTPFSEPTDFGATMFTIDQIMGAAPAVDAAGAVVGDVCTGKTFWGLTGGAWGPRTGTGPCTPLFTQTYGPFTVAEDAATATNIGTPVTASGGGSIVYSITAGNTGSVFAIDGSSGQITRSASGTVNYESTRTYTLRVRGTLGAATTDTLVTVNVTNVDDNSPIFQATGPFKIAEGASSGTVVGKLVATDADGNSLTYSITGGNAGDVFAIDGSSGQITRSASGTVDYETTKSYTLTVEATDGSAPVASASVTVAVTNDNDTNPAISPAAPIFTVLEDAPVGARVGAVTATDSDGDTLSYSITAGNGAGKFAIGSATGQITVAAGLDRETTASYSLTVTVSDGDAGHDQTATATVNISNVDESPSVGTNNGFSLVESTSHAITNGELSVDDVDSQPARRRMVVTRVPANGTLEVNTTGSTWVLLNAGRSFFTQDDIDNGDVRYDNDGTTGADSFRFRLLNSDGTTQAEQTVSITVNPATP